MIKKMAIGIFAGLICGLFGTGGGMILVPAFVYMLKINPKKARGTSLCCMLVMVITSSIFYYKNNYINWQAGLLCAVGSASCAFMFFLNGSHMTEIMIFLAISIFLGCDITNFFLFCKHCIHNIAVAATCLESYPIFLAYLFLNIAFVAQDIASSNT